MALSLGGSAMAQFNCDRLISIGRNALYFEDYVLAIQYFNQVIALKPYMYEPYLLRAIAKLELEDWEGALKDCDAVVERNPFLSNIYYTRGYVHRQLGHWQEAESDFTEALRYSPDNRHYLLLRADVRCRGQMLDKAGEDIDALLVDSATQSDLLHERAVIYLQQGDTTHAIQYFERVAELEPGEPSNWSLIGTLYLMRGDEKNARPYLDKAIKAGSTWEGDYVNRGIISYRAHDYRTAIADYDKAVKLAPKDIRCHYNRALLLQEVGDYHRALEAYNRVITLSPKSYEMYYNRGLVHLQLMHWQQALQDMQVTMKYYPYFVPAYVVAGQAKIMLGDNAGAQDILHKADAIDKRKATSHLTPQPLTESKVVEPKPKPRNRRKEFSVRQAQSTRVVTDEERKYDSDTRGAVHTIYTDAVPEPNITLSYYAPSEPLRRTVYTHAVLEELNTSQVLPAPLRMVVKEVVLTAPIIAQHFEQIAALTQRIDEIERTRTSPGQDLAMLHFTRAIEYAMVQDYASSIEDCTQAINLVGSNVSVAGLLYLTRANLRVKQQEYLKANNQLPKATAKLDRELILKDYDAASHLIPSLSIVYYNKGNYLYSLHDCEGAIQAYTEAIRYDKDFAEAYFNRGLSYMYLNRVTPGLEDLSRAGECGIYQAYNLMKRLR